ncbi:NUDIX domain-containing protein [Cupriavidus basilensis]|uniref:NUDIX domain-containing protein n=1 Tax=Cupriavidus basilensis TaxID=68895 RepID=A0ABT6B186_9BURK|nr:NUDIX domain-containing protein [Cupriavidus basilensis]MDF3838635.1 NUDIX domain-containing protein [Cupriavidus basilensis]
MNIKNKVLVYLTWRDSLLSFTQPEFPDAGRQVIAGTIESNEEAAAAALRELSEESGIGNAEIERVLGNYYYSMSKFGRNEIQHRHVVHARLSDAIPIAETWTHFERHPSTGGEPIEFRLQWLPLFKKEPELIAGHGFFIPMLEHFLRENMAA